MSCFEKWELIPFGVSSSELIECFLICGYETLLINAGDFFDEELIDKIIEEELEAEAEAKEELKARIAEAAKDVDTDFVSDDELDDDIDYEEE